MALTNTLLNPPTISTATGGNRKKYTVGVQDLKNLGAFTTGTIILDNLPAGAVVTSSRIKHSASVLGGAITASTARLQFGTTALGSSALDTFQAPGVTDGTHAITGVTPTGAPLSGTTILQMNLTSTTANLAAVTAGSIDAYIDYLILL